MTAPGGQWHDSHDGIRKVLNFIPTVALAQKVVRLKDCENMRKCKEMRSFVHKAAEIPEFLHLAAVDSTGMPRYNRAVKSIAPAAPERPGAWAR